GLYTPLGVTVRYGGAPFANSLDGEFARMKRYYGWIVLWPTKRFPRPTWSEFIRSCERLPLFTSSGAPRKRACNQQPWSTKHGSGSRDIPGRAARISWLWLRRPCAICWWITCEHASPKSVGGNGPASPSMAVANPKA